MKMKCARDVMLPLEAFPYIPHWFTLRQALAELGGTAAPRNSPKNTPWIILVFNAQSEFLGIVQRQDILRGLNPEMPGKARGIVSSYSPTRSDPNLSRMGFSAEKGLQEIKNHIERPISEFMTPVQIMVEDDDPILLAIYMMIEYDLTFVPVTQENRIVGVIYVEDALNEVVASVL
jgi:CBS domain-containing protein